MSHLPEPVALQSETEPRALLDYYLLQHGVDHRFVSKEDVPKQKTQDYSSLDEFLQEDHPLFNVQRLQCEMWKQLHKSNIF